MKLSTQTWQSNSLCITSTLLATHRSGGCFRFQLYSTKRCDPPTAMLQIVRMEAADRIVLKPNRVGGLWPARRIVDICEANDRSRRFHTMPFTLLGDTMLCHLGATIKHHFPLDAQGHTFFAGTPQSVYSRSKMAARVSGTRPDLASRPSFVARCLGKLAWDKCRLSLWRPGRQNADASLPPNVPSRGGCSWQVRTPAGRTR